MKNIIINEESGKEETWTLHEIGVSEFLVCRTNLVNDYGTNYGHSYYIVHNGCCKEDYYALECHLGIDDINYSDVWDQTHITNKEYPHTEQGYNDYMKLREEIFFS